MRLAMLRCAYCGSQERSVFLHHGKLSCALCLRSEPGDDMAVQVKIAIVRAEANREEGKRVRRR